MVFLEDLLNAGDFRGAVNGLAREFTDQHKFPGIHQLGLVVSNAEEVADTLETQGIGPFFIASGSPVFWRERGRELSFSGKMGLAYHKGVELELLEPGEGSDFYRQSLDPEGRTVVQHLGLLVKDVDDSAQRPVKEGLAVWIRGRLQLGPAKVDFAYIDTLKELDLIPEFISWRIFGWACRPPARIFRGSACLMRWSGKRSVSV
ncbi:MAG: hypothetical protein GTO12_27390 [Proteobacteria bacterium]|nr:hypothetical protein [Pseudomonadota bacterium]